MKTKQQKGFIIKHSNISYFTLQDHSFKAIDLKNKTLYEKNISEADMFEKAGLMCCLIGSGLSLKNIIDDYGWALSSIEFIHLTVNSVDVSRLYETAKKSRIVHLHEELIHCKYSLDETNIKILAKILQILAPNDKQKEIFNITTWNAKKDEI